MATRNRRRLRHRRVHAGVARLGRHPRRPPSRSPSSSFWAIPAPAGRSVRTSSPAFYAAIGRWITPGRRHRGNSQHRVLRRRGAGTARARPRALLGGRARTAVRVHRPAPPEAGIDYAPFRCRVGRRFLMSYRGEWTYSWFMPTPLHPPRRACRRDADRARAPWGDRDPARLHPLRGRGGGVSGGSISGPSPSRWCSSWTTTRSCSSCRGAHEVDLANTGKRLQGNLTRAPLDMVRIATGQPIGGYRAARTSHEPSDVCRQRPVAVRGTVGGRRAPGHGLPHVVLGVGADHRGPGDRRRLNPGLFTPL